jgi:23S rRNA maturation-related 3'-5' exoribonuclease YhaM
MDLKDKFFAFIKEVDRSGIEDLIEHAIENGYFTAPSSSQYHNACEGGNLKHSLIVTDVLLGLRDALVGSYDAKTELAHRVPVESCIICGLFHDLGKAMYYSKPHYIPNRLKGGRVSDSKPYCCNPDRLPIPHQLASVHILSQYIQLTEEEAFAIFFHNGLYTPDGRVIQGKETPLLMLLHWADMWASRIIDARKPEANGKGAACNAD